MASLRKLILGNLTREECEELLENSANPQGAYLLRYSTNKQQFILSGIFRGNVKITKKIVSLAECSSKGQTAQKPRNQLKNQRLNFLQVMESIKTQNKRWQLLFKIRALKY